jgi:transcriptional regulator with XRE-family HTH domain
LPIVNIGKLLSVAKREIERTPFGQRLLQARTRAGLKQIPAAKAVGIGQSSLAELEKVGMGSNFTTSLARLYGCDAHWLATGEGDPGWGGAQAGALGELALSPTEWDLLREYRDMDEDDRRFIEQEVHARSERWRKMRDKVLARFGVNGAADPENVKRALGNVPKDPPAKLPTTPRRPQREKIAAPFNLAEKVAAKAAAVKKARS